MNFEIIIKAIEGEIKRQKNLRLDATIALKEAESIAAIHKFTINECDRYISTLRDMLEQAKKGLTNG